MKKLATYLMACLLFGIVSCSTDTDVLQEENEIVQEEGDETNEDTDGTSTDEGDSTEDENEDSSDTDDSGDTTDDNGDTTDGNEDTEGDTGDTTGGDNGDDTSGNSVCNTTRAFERDAKEGGFTGDDLLVTPSFEDWFMFENVDFTGADKLILTAARDSDNTGNIEIRLGAPSGSGSTLLGSIDVATGGWRTFRDLELTLPNGVSGNQSLYLVGGNYSKAVVQRIQVNGNTPFDAYAANFDDMNENLFKNAFDFISIQNTWYRFDNVAFNGAKSMNLSIANGTTGKLQIRIGSENGTLLAEVDVRRTDWRDFVNYSVSFDSVDGNQDLYFSHNSGSHGGILQFFELCD